MENGHDLDGIMGTFGASARYDEEPWGDHHIGREAVRAYYAGLLRAMPDLAIDVCGRHVADDAVVLEVRISGHHLGVWRGLPSTGRPVRFLLCGIFTFDDDDRLAGEEIYYDRATVIRQIGVFHEPNGTIGRIRGGDPASADDGAGRRKNLAAVETVTQVIDFSKFSEQSPSKFKPVGIARRFVYKQRDYVVFAVSMSVHSAT